MEYIIGVILGVAVAAAGRIIGLDRERAFYSTVLIVVAFYYVLFAVMGAPATILAFEIAFGLAFTGLAAYGFRRSMWLVAAGIAGHGLFDFTRHLFIHNSGVPVWWPGFCGSIDLALGAWVAFCLLTATSAPAPADS